MLCGTAGRTPDACTSRRDSPAARRYGALQSRICRAWWWTSGQTSPSRSLSRPSAGGAGGLDALAPRPRAQRRVGCELGSASAVADSKQTLLCTYLSAVLLADLVLSATSAAPGPIRSLLCPSPSRKAATPGRARAAARPWQLRSRLNGRRRTSAAAALAVTAATDRPLQARSGTRARLTMSL